MEKKCRVEVTKFAEKQLRRVPNEIFESFIYWKDLIHQGGLRKMRIIRSFHDEPLKGSRQGQRSSKLNQSYRVVYFEKDETEVIVICVIEVNKHEY